MSIKLFKPRTTKRPRTYKQGSTCKVLEASSNYVVNYLCVKTHGITKQLSM